MRLSEISNLEIAIDIKGLWQSLQLPTACNLASIQAFNHKNHKSKACAPLFAPLLPMDYRQVEEPKPGGLSQDAARGDFPPRVERLILATLVAVQFTSIVDFMILMPLGPQVLKALDIGTNHFGWLVSSYTFAAGIAGLLAATLLDRYDRKTVFVVLYIGFIIGTLCCGFASSFALLLAARIVTGAFGGILGGQAMAIVGDVFPPNRRGYATGAVMSGFAIASVIGVPAGIVIGNLYGWQAPFFVLTVLSLPLLGLAMWAMPSLTGHCHDQHASLLGHLRETLTLPNHIRAYALISVLTFGAFTVIPFISTYYVANAGVTEAQLPFIFIAGGLITLVGAPYLGKMADRYGKLRLFRLIVPISALMVLVITNLPSLGIIWAAAATSGLMLTNTGRMVAAMAMVTNSVEARQRGAFMSVNSSMQHLAGGFGTALGGMIVQGGSGQPFLHFEKVGYLAAGTSILGIWLAGRLRLLDGPQVPATISQSIAAAVEAQADAGEVLASLEANEPNPLDRDERAG